MSLSSLSPMPQSIAQPTDFQIDRIRGFIADYVGVDVNKVIDDAHFCDDLGLDWLERLELVLRIEDETGIEISDSDATRIERVGSLLRHIEFAATNGKDVTSRTRDTVHSPAASPLRLEMIRPLSRPDAAGDGASHERWKTPRATCNY